MPFQKNDEMSKYLLAPNEKLLPGFAAGAAEAPFPVGFVSVFPNWNVEVTPAC